MLDAERRVLLVRFEHPVSGDSWWAPTGGGIEPGETEEEALRRELLGGGRARRVRARPDGPHARAHVPVGARIIHAARAVLRRAGRPRTTRVPTIDVAAEGVTEVRWWSLAELDATGERIIPSELAELVRSLAP